MNRSYRSIWNESLGAWVAASEISQAKGKSKNGRTLIKPVLMALLLSGAMSSSTWASTAFGGSMTSGPGISCTTPDNVGLSTSVWTCQISNGSGGFATVTGIQADPNSSYFPDPAQISAWRANNLGTGSIAMGSLATRAVRQDSIAIGTAAQATGFASFAAGSNAVASDGYGIAIGYGARSLGQDGSSLLLDVGAVAIGNQAVAYARSVSVGLGTGSAGVGGSVSIGSDGDGSVAGKGIGTGALSSGRDHVAIGTESGIRSNGQLNVAVGGEVGNNVTGDANVTVGGLHTGRNINGSRNISFGGQDVGEVVTGADNVAIGGQNTGRSVNGSRNIALGTRAGNNVTADDTLAIGTGSNAGANGGVALGTSTVASGVAAVALGQQAAATQANAIAIGTAAQALGESSIAVGRDAIATGSVAMGAAAKAGNGGAAFGDGAVATYMGGVTTAGTVAGAALGQNAKADVSGAVALGTNAIVSAANSVALGTNSVADMTYSTQSAYVPAGAASVAGSVAVGQVSVGSAGQERRITNLAAGATDTDAVNVSQLKAVSAVAGKGWNVATSGNATASNVAPESKVTFNGDSNVTVNHSTDATGTKVDVTLNPNLSVTSLTAGGTKVNNSGVSFTSGTVALTSAGLNNGDNKIINVAAGTAPSDAVNLSQLQTMTSGVATHFYSVNSSDTTAANYANDGATGKNALAAGVGASAQGDDAVAVGEAKAAGLGAVAIGKGASAADINSVALGAGSQSKAAMSIASDALLIPATTLNFAGATNVLGVVSVGSASGTRQIVNVAPGELSASSTDAVNGSQLFAVAKGLNDRIDNIQLTPGPVGPQGAQGPVGPSVKPGTGSGSGNEWIDGNVATFTPPSPSGQQSLAAGSGAVASGTNATAIGNGAVASGNSATALGQGATATGAGSVAIGNNSSDAGRANVVSVGSAGAERQVTNVAPATQGTDAVNLNQLNQMGTTISNQFGNMQNQINQNQREANAGTAGAMAMAGMPQAYMPGKSMLAAGAANFRGESALAVGMSSISDNGRWVTKFTGSANSRGQVGVSVGAGYQW